MILKIKSYLLIAMSSIMLAIPLAMPAAVYANCKTNIGNNIAQGASETSNGTANIDCENQGDVEGSLGKLALQVVNLFSFVVGAVAVIMIIYGGFRYITSGGGAESVGSAKKTLIYAIIGLVIVAVAQILVRFVLSTTNNAINI